MKDAYINGKIIDGTKEMHVKEGYAILVEQGKIKDIVLQEEADLNGYHVVDLKGQYIMPGQWSQLKSKMVPIRRTTT